MQQKLLIIIVGAMMLCYIPALAQQTEPGTQQESEVIFAAVNLEELPALRQIVPAGISVAARVWDKGVNVFPSLETQVSFVNNHQIPYYITAVSSDFTSHAGFPSAYQPMDKIERYLADPSCKGVYVHALLSWLAYQKDWDWHEAATQVDWAYMEQLLLLAARYDKQVVWSEPSRAWEAVSAGAYLQRWPELADRLTLLYATNFPNDVSIARDHAITLAADTGCGLGINIQDWFFVDQGIPTSQETTIALLQEAYRASATVYQVEGTGSGMTASSVFMKGVSAFLKEQLGGDEPPLQQQQAACGLRDQEMEVVFAAVNLELIPGMRDQVPEGIKVAGRVWNKNVDPSLAAQVEYLEEVQLPYYVTAISSDFFFHAGFDSFYRPFAEIERYLQRPDCLGIYIHELLAGLAFQTDWNWLSAAATVDWDYVNQLFQLVSLYGKRILWAEPCRGWEAVWSGDYLKPWQEMASQITLLYGTNFPNDVHIARQFAGTTASGLGAALGVSIQDWFFVDQNLPVSKDTTIQLLQEASEAGATVYQVEGTWKSMWAESVFMDGIATFLADAIGERN